MASEEPVQKTKQEVFKVHSMVRDIATRNQRMKAAAHHRFVQRFGGGRITVRRARPATVTKAMLMAHLAEIKKAVAEGKVIVKTLTGAVVDLETLQAEPQALVSKPLPNPPADSVKNDQTFEKGVGEKIPLFPDGGVPGGDRPPLGLTTSALDDDQKPIVSGGGDPARARAQEEQRKQLEETTGGEGDDEVTQPDAEPVTDPSESTTEEETNPTGKRGKDKKSGGKGGSK